MSNLMHDLRFAFRTLVKQPVFGITVLLMLVLGIGANAAIFGIVNGYLLRPLPFPEPGELVQFDVRAPRWNLDYVAMAYPDFHAWRERNSTFQAMAVAGAESFNLSGDGDAIRVQGARVSHDMADVLGIQPILGREFMADDDRPGAPNIALLTEGFWEERWGADPNIIGGVVRLNSEPYTIVGVLPDEAAFVQGARLWTPLREELDATSGNYFLIGFARLNEGVSKERALADLERIHETLKEDGPASAETYPVLDGILDRETGESRGPLVALSVAVVLLLLIACANIAGLMLARALARAKEMGIRVSMGAGRGRVIRQLLTESLLLATLGGAGGALLGLWGTSLILTTMPQDLPSWLSFGPDWRFVLFVIGVVGATAVISGLYPALKAGGGGNYCVNLDATTRSTTSPSRNRGLQAMVVAEVSLSMVLLLMAGLSLRDLREIMSIDPGFRTEGILLYSVALPDAEYEESGSRIRFFEDHLTRLRALPGVEGVGVASAAPLGGHWGQFFVAEGAPELGPDDVAPVTLVRVVTPGYMEAMGIRLLGGRFLDENDGRDDGSRAVIVNETWARNNFPDGEAVGKRIRNSWSDAPWLTVVGVTEDTKHYGLETEMRQGIFQPLAQVPISSGTVVVHAGLDPLALVSQARELVRQADPDVPMIQPRTMSDVMDRSEWGRRMAAWLFGAFAVLALILAVGGIYGVLSYTVTQRNLEIGIRMALGAQGGQVLGQVLRQGLTLVGMGVGIGLMGAYGMARAASSIFFGVGAGEPLLYVLAAGILLAVGVLANLLPARKAARVSPMGALRAGE